MDDDSYVRRLLSFICFTKSAFPELSGNSDEIWNFETVRAAFAKWLMDKNRDIISISRELDDDIFGSSTFVWYKIDKNRYAGIMLLYSILGFYKSRRGKKDKHGILIQDILECISKGVYPTKAILDEVNFTFYWDNQVMGYYTKVLQLKDMSNDDFKALPKQSQWLNSF